jgi:hypothetical protein
MMGKPTTMDQNELVSPLPHCDSPSLLSHVAPDSTFGSTVAPGTQELITAEAVQGGELWRGWLG